MLLLNGCGGGSKNSAQTGQVQLRIVWPERTAQTASSRYLPAYAASILFELAPKNDPTNKSRLIVNRPEGDRPSSQTVTFHQVLNVGDYVLAASARVGADAQGATVASAVVNVAVSEGMNPVDLALTSTIRTISILGQPLSATVGTPVTLQSGAFDPDGRTLLVPSGALTWSIVSGGGFGTLTSAGLLTPTAPGTMRVKLAEVGAGLSSEADITITDQVITAELGATPYPKEFADLFNRGLVTGSGATGVQSWIYDLGASTGFYVSTPILGANGLVYGVSLVGTNNSATAYAINAVNGTKAWQVTLNGFQPYSPVVLSTNVVCFPLGNTGVVGLDANTGVERWRNNDAQAVGAATVDRSGHLLVPTRTGVVAINPSNGSSLFSYPGTNCTMPAIGQDGTVYYVRSLSGDSRDGQLVAANPTTHQPIWTANEIEQGHTPVIGPNGRVYVIGSQAATAFTRLVSFNPANGTVVNEVRNQFFNFSQDPAFGSDGLLYVGQGNKVTAYNVDLGQVRQSQAITGTGDFFNTRHITIGSDGTLYVIADVNSPDSPGILLAFNTSDLTEKWRYDFTGRVLGNVALGATGQVYILTDTGKVIALH
jgi:outer membrane protein assembly factor BamB